MPFDEALDRPAASGDQLGAWDDLPVHQTAAPLGVVAPDVAGWTERFYFNVVRASGELAAIVGGAVYPNRGVSESYCCVLDGPVQRNLRAWGPLPGTGAFSFRCEVPLRDWTVTSPLFSGRFRGVSEPYLYGPIDVPGEDEFDLYRHFVAAGRWEATDCIGFRDRTWGIRTRRIRLHNWYVFRLGEATLNLMHQERADGSVFFSEAGVVFDAGRVERLEIAAHALVFDPGTRAVQEGRIDFAGGLRLEFTSVGEAIRLAGAGYDPSQGARASAAGEESDAYDLSDPDVARRRGTMDAGAVARVCGPWSAEGIGVVETAVARDHVTYGGGLA
jgi:hypothetical protein